MAVPEVENKIIRQRPEDCHEGDQQNRGLQQTNTKIGGQLGKVARILVHALIGVNAHRSG